jgi:hypothetical protein
MKRIEIIINETDFDIIKKAAEAAKNDSKRKNYGISSYMKESSINRAKRIIK